MKMPKPTDDDRRRFHDLVPEAPGVEVRPMFGNLGAFLKGNMFMGLFGSHIGLKLTEDDRERLLAQPGSGPFGPPERPMGGYVTLPAAWTAQDAKPWIEKSLATVSNLLPKVKKKKG
jgi:TfoX/Sxy family transcriptional regulator of competence genes